MKGFYMKFQIHQYLKKPLFFFYKFNNTNKLNKLDKNAFLDLKPLYKPKTNPNLLKNDEIFLKDLQLLIKSFK